MKLSQEHKLDLIKRGFYKYERKEKDEMGVDWYVYKLRAWVIILFALIFLSMIGIIAFYFSIPSSVSLPATVLLVWVIASKMSCYVRIKIRKITAKHHNL